MIGGEISSLFSFDSVEAEWNEVQIAKACMHKNENAVPKGWFDIKVSLSAALPH